MKYALPVLVLISALILSSCTNYFGGSKQPDTSFHCRLLKEGRGVVADFVQYAPPGEIREGRPFTLGLAFSNSFEDAITVDLQLQDTIDIPEFPDEGISQSVLVEGSLVENNLWHEPGCRLMGENGLTELSLGPYIYRPVTFDDEVQFRGTLNYHAITDASLSACAFNPAMGPSTGCSTQQTYHDFGWKNSKAPIFITSADKTLIGSKDGVTLQLTFDIANAGGGYAGGDGLVDFSLDGEGITFNCYSDQTHDDRGNMISLLLDQETERAQVHCETFLSLDRMQVFPVTIHLQHDYTYPFSSVPAKLKPGTARDTEA